MEALLLLTPGAFLSALIVFPKFRRFCLWLIAAWILVYGVLCYSASAEEALVLCEMNSSGVTKVTTDGWCRVYHVMKDHALDDILRSHSNTKTWEICMESLELMSPDPMRTHRAARVQLCGDVLQHATNEWVTARR